MAHAGEHVYGSAEFACIELQQSRNFTGRLCTMTGHVDSQDGIKDAIVDLRHGERLYGDRCEEVLLLVDENMILDGDVALVEGVCFEGFHLVLKLFSAIRDADSMDEVLVVLSAYVDSMDGVLFVLSVYADSMSGILGVLFAYTDSTSGVPFVLFAYTDSTSGVLLVLFVYADRTSGVLFVLFKVQNTS